MYRLMKEGPNLSFYLNFTSCATATWPDAVAWLNLSFCFFPLLFFFEGIVLQSAIIWYYDQSKKKTMCIGQ